MFITIKKLIAVQIVAVINLLNMDLTNGYRDINAKNAIRLFQKLQILYRVIQGKI